MSDVNARLARFAWGVLAYNVAVIAWGAYVRATGSGAGCGSHWPLCDGQVVPRAASAEMLVEFSHRVTSGLALMAVVALVWWVRRARPPGHGARRASHAALGFVLAEAAVGAGLVLFELVADNASMARAMFMAVHLVNTFFLLAALTLTAFLLLPERAAPAVEPAPRRAAVWSFGVATFGLLAVGASGAVAALGDTLFPASSLGEALRADLSPTSHLLIRLRLLHPVISVAVALGVIALTVRFRPPRERRRAHLASQLVMGLTLGQIGAGLLNVALLAPVWMQLLHLLLADALWIAFVVFAASSVAGRGRAAGAGAVGSVAA